MREERIAARYGRALFMCTTEESMLIQIDKELSALASLMDARSSDLRTVMLNPAFSQREQNALINEMATSFQLQPLTRDFLLLLIEKGRVALLSSVAKIFSSELDVKLGRVRARVSSAKPLSEAQLADVIGALHRRIGKTIVPEVSIDERAVMGVKAQIGGLVFDGTLSTMLDRFKRTLVDAPIHG